MPLTDANLHRSIEVLQATAARRGDTTLKSNEAALLIGRLLSIGMEASGMLTRSDLDDDARRAFAAIVSSVGACLSALRVSEDDANLVLRTLTSEIAALRES
jgi:hypothetical protein